MNTKLGQAESAAALETTQGWSLEGERLTRSFHFQSYSSGAAFAVQVMLLAEKTDHHPDSLEIGWKRVTVRFVTHSAGGLTLLDFEAARRVSALVTS